MTLFKRTFVGRYLQQQNGIGKGRLSFRTIAASAWWSMAVAATYSIINNLRGFRVRALDAINNYGVQESADGHCLVSYANE